MIVKMGLFGKGAWLKEINQHSGVGELNEPQGRLGWILFLFLAMIMNEFLFLLMLWIDINPECFFDIRVPLLPTNPNTIGKGAFIKSLNSLTYFGYLD